MEYPLDNEIKELFYKGFTNQMIAKKIGISTNIVERTLMRLGLYHY
jgi:DNA-binding NarL/FixJ family response regulator